MQYTLYPKRGSNDVRSLIESATGMPAQQEEELALCCIDEIIVDSSDGKWTVQASGPSGSMTKCISALGSALKGYNDATEIRILYSPTDKDEWVKDNWQSIAEQASVEIGLNIGSLLACEPGWDVGLHVSAPSEAQAESLKRNGFQDCIRGIIKSLTGDDVDVRVGVASKRRRDYSESLPKAVEPTLVIEEPAVAGNYELVAGNPIKIPSIPISSDLPISDFVSFEGKVIKPEVRTSRRGKSILSFVMTDGTGVISCRYAFESKNPPELSGRYRIAGFMSIDDERPDKAAPEPFLMVEDIETAPAEICAPDRVCHRVELHCHSKMSSLDSVCDPEAMAEIAASLGQRSIALTDHGVVHAFPVFYEACRRNGIKPILGMEGYMKGDGDETSHLSLLVRNRQGLINLYKMVSASHLEHFRRHPLLPRQLVEQHREGLLIGSACASGDVFKAALSGDDGAVLSAMAFYDYIEIMPAANSSFLVREGRLPDLDAIREINLKLVRLAKASGKTYVATGDVHYLQKEDSELRKVLLAGQDFKDVLDQPDLHLRSTGEMLSEFSYLGADDCLEAVVLATNRIADSIEVLKPVPDGLTTPILKGAEDEVRDVTLSEAERLYGNPLPDIVEQRIEKELRSIIGNGFASIYAIAMRLVRKSMQDGYLVGSRGSVGSSLVASMLGITEVNPLPPHYRCDSCKTSDFGPFAERHGFDLPEKPCPACGKKMGRDGHDIPFEVFLGFEGDKVPDIDLNFSGEYQPRIHKYCEEMFGSDNVFRAGTIGTIAEKTAYGFVRAFEERTGSRVSRAKSDLLAAGTSGVRRTTGQHPGGIIILPEGRDIHEFTPIQHPANSKEKGIITTHFEYTALHDNLLKLDLLGHDDPTMIRMLEDITGKSFRDIPYDDAATMSIFSGVEALGLDKAKYAQEVGTVGIPEFGTRFVRGMLSETRPSAFEELVRISGLSHGTGVWLDNAQDIIRSGDGALKDVISVRDDIMNYLIGMGMKHKSAFQVMEKVRKGRGLTDDDEKSMRHLKVPQWYIESCNKIKYMFPKAHACAYVMMAFRIAYAKVHMPEAFYSAYLTIRAVDFDPSFASMAVKDMDRMIRSIDSNKASTQKEKDTVPVLEVIREALLRGLKLKPVDLMRSDAFRFRSEEGGIRAPLLSVPRLGQKPAENIAESRLAGPFDSVEELKDRASLGKTQVDALREAGALQGIRESRHPGLF